VTRYATIPTDGPRLDPARLEGPIPYGRWRVFLALNERFAVAITDPGGEEPMLSMVVADVEGHPFDLTPTAVGRDRVCELRDALTVWLERTA